MLHDPAPGTFTALAPELHPSRGNNLFVFGLP